MIILKLAIYLSSWIVNLDQATWDEKLLGGMDFMSKSVLQVPFLLMTLMGYITPTLDEMLVNPAQARLLQPGAYCCHSFMQSVEWVDSTYIQKHQSENPDTLRAMYYPSLVMFPTKTGPRSSRPKSEAIKMFVQRYAKRMGTLLGVYLLSLTPVIGRFVMPAASFYTFRSHVGTAPAAVIFGAGLVLPKAMIVKFLHTYFASRSLMRELVRACCFTLNSLPPPRLTMSTA